MVPTNLPIGTAVFFVDKYVGSSIQKATIQKSFNQDTNYYGILSTHFSFGSPIDRLFLTKEEAVEFTTKREMDFKRELKSELNTKEDLLNYLFGFVNCESAAFAEIEILKEKSKELFGISIEN